MRDPKLPGGTGRPTMKMTFQVAEVSKPLVAVCRLVEKGNVVNFGPDEGDNYILNKGSGKRVKLFPNGEGSYLMRVETLEGKKAEVKVDSAADESVCPEGWLSEFGIVKPKEKMSFRGANGAHIKHIGERSIKVVSPF